MKREIPDEVKFVVYGDSGMTMFSWLSPYIVEAGYKYTFVNSDKEIGKAEITIIKINEKNSIENL